MTAPTEVCGSTEWRHVCHLPKGHHGPHGDCGGGCDETWPNESELSPCLSTEVAILGVLEPSGARLRCGLLDGHQGAHRFIMEWGSP